MSRRPHLGRESGEVGAADGSVKGSGRTPLPDPAFTLVDPRGEAVDLPPGAETQTLLAAANASSEASGGCRAAAHRGTQASPVAGSPIAATRRDPRPGAINARGARKPIRRPAPGEAGRGPEDPNLLHVLRPGSLRRGGRPATTHSAVCRAAGAPRSRRAHDEDGPGRVRQSGRDASGSATDPPGALFPRGVTWSVGSDHPAPHHPLSTSPISAAVISGFVPIQSCRQQQAARIDVWWPGE